ncbi:AAA family ATPase [Vibrio splendidus]
MYTLNLYFQILHCLDENAVAPHAETARALSVIVPPFEYSAGYISRLEERVDINDEQTCYEPSGESFNKNSLLTQSREFCREQSLQTPNLDFVKKVAVLTFNPNISSEVSVRQTIVSSLIDIPVSVTNKSLLNRLCEIRNICNSNEICIRKIWYGLLSILVTFEELEPYYKDISSYSSVEQWTRICRIFLDDYAEVWANPELNPYIDLENDKVKHCVKVLTALISMPDIISIIRMFGQISTLSDIEHDYRSSTIDIYNPVIKRLAGTHLIAVHANRNSDKLSNESNQFENASMDEFKQTTAELKNELLTSEFIKEVNLDRTEESLEFTFGFTDDDNSEAAQVESHPKEVKRISTPHLTLASANLSDKVRKRQIKISKAYTKISSLIDVLVPNDEIDKTNTLHISVIDIEAQSEYFSDDVRNEILMGDFRKPKDNEPSYYLYNNPVLLDKVPLAEPQVNVEDKLDRLFDRYPNFHHLKNSIASDILYAQVNHKEIQLPAILLDGPPGTGKSAFCMDLAEALDITSSLFTIGNTAHPSELFGLTISYSSAHPGQIITSIVNAGYANPMLILDEIDKIGHNNCEYAGLIASLLNLLEPKTATRIRNPFFEAELNLSKLNLIGTSNDKNHIHYALLNRFKCFSIKELTEKQKIHVIETLNFEAFIEHSPTGEPYTPLSRRHARQFLPLPIRKIKVLLNSLHKTTTIQQLSNRNNWH